jgi:hypothetical protein
MSVPYEPQIKGIACDVCKCVLYMQIGNRNRKLPDLHYCPACGTKGEQCSTLSEAFYIEMHYKYGLPVELLKQLYQNFLHQLHDDGHTKDFTTYLKRLVTKG